MANMDENNSANTNRPILVLTASAGAGHLMAAEAIRVELERQAPDYPVEIVDVLKLTNRCFRKLYADGYLFLVNHFPSAMGWLYDQTDQTDTPTKDRFRRWFQRLHAKKLIRFLERKQPSLIVNTHFLSAEIVAEMKTNKQLSCPQVTITTDLDAHRLWVQPPTQRYYAASELGKASLVEFGVMESDIAVTGIPVRHAFENDVNAEDVRAKLGLDPKQPTVLLLSGGLGVGPTHALFLELLRMPEHIQIITVAGRNETLKRRLEASASSLSRNVAIVGFTDSIQELMRTSDIVVTKPGGLTTSECLVCGLPMVIMNPIPGQESRNSDLLLERGAAIKINNLRTLGRRIAELLDNPDQLAEIRQKATILGKPDATKQIVSDALSVAKIRAI